MSHHRSSSSAPPSGPKGPSPRPERARLAPESRELEVEMRARKERGSRGWVSQHFVATRRASGRQVCGITLKPVRQFYTYQNVSATLEQTDS